MLKSKRTGKKKNSSARSSPFEIDLKFKDPFRKIAFGIVKKPLEKFFYLKKLSSVYEQISLGSHELFFPDVALSLLNVWYDVSEESLKRIPQKGPVIVVANHPFGAIEGILMASLLASVRPDIKILANYLLARIPEMRPLIFSVDPFGSKKAKTRNLKPMREALNWVKQGGALAIFPAGEVAHLNLRRSEVADPRWSESIARFIRRTQAPVLPVYFDGRNGVLFQIMGLVHPRLRTVMLPHELLNKSNRRIPVRVGHLIPYHKLAEIKDDADLIAYIRLRTYLLINRADTPSAKSARTVFVKRQSAFKIIAEPESQKLLIRDIEQLPAENLLAEHEEYAVYRASMSEIPHLIREIGRLREVTFRCAGEGSGKTLDLDQVDNYYDHLFVWNREKQEIVGAYRAAATDKIIKQYGVDGLYTSTLFKYKKPLLNQIGPALELGRSFVRPEYQRLYAPLNLLWVGIGQLIVREPRYRILFGPVSINNSYQTASRKLMVNFLKANSYDSNLARLVKAKSPLKTKKPKKWDERAARRLIVDIKDMASLISDIEADQQGVPVLLRHYLRLGGKLLGFNIDPDFSDVLDGLVLVDLTQTDPHIMERYLGREGYNQFLEYHHLSNPIAKS